MLNNNNNGKTNSLECRGLFSVDIKPTRGCNETRCPIQDPVTLVGERECRCNERQNEAGESGTKVKKKKREERGKGEKRGRQRIVTRNARTTLPRSWGQLTVHATTITTIDFDGPHHPSPPSLPLLPSLFFFSFLLV